MMQPAGDARLDRTLVALADPTRRALLERLSQGEARVTELAAPFSISLNSVSKHIRMLERAELVRRRVAGKEHLLSFNRAPLEEAAQWIESQRALWTRRLQALDDLLRAEDRALAAAKASKPQRLPKGGPR
ncbi:MAG TPA: metalloregulator ArsR/SmtB family transcription factor [Polyangiaceae bacterium]|nr:metalloregulator ArsR/SmtB family transcription factor [Polyangiaceae bacterium]